MKNIEKCLFYVKGNEMVAELSGYETDVKRVIYDMHNALYICNGRDEVYKLQNIVPKVRDLLRKNKNIVVAVQKQNGKYLDIMPYEVTLEKKILFSNQDDFINGSKKLYLKILKFMFRDQLKKADNQ